MPRRSVPGAQYPPDWKEIAQRVKDEAGWMCLRCRARHNPPDCVMTVHHLDMNPANSAWWNLVPLCSRCHLSVQARVDLDRPWVLLPHSEWFKIHAGGWYAFRYLGELLTRDEVTARLDELLQLERRAVLGVAS